MALFQRRPLALSCCVLILSAALSYFLTDGAQILLWAVAGGGALVLGVLFFFLPRLRRAAALLALLIGVFVGGIRAFCDLRVGDAAFEERIGTSVEAEMTVKEIRYASSHGSELLVRVSALEGEDCHVSAVLRCEEAFPLYVGDRFYATVTVRPLGYENEKMIYRYLGEGADALLLLQDTQSVLLLESGTGSVAERLSSLRAILSHRIRSATGGEAGNLLSAMLLGTRTELSERTVRDFRRSGTSHLLAISGLHLVLLVGLLDRLLYALGAGKRARIGVSALFCAGYLLLTGCSASMLRAVLMLGIVYLAFVLKADYDAVTALMLAGALIVLCQPGAVFSTSFQMTLLATFGLLTFGRVNTALCARLSGGDGAGKWWRRCLRWLISSLCVSLSATLAILPVLWLCFGEMSLLTPLSNLILVPLSPFLLVGALLLLAFPVPFLGAAVGGVATLALRVAAAFSALPGMISLRWSFVPWILVPFLALSVLLIVLDLKKRWWLVLMPALLATVAFAICLPIAQAGNTELQVVYRRAGESEGIVLTQGDIAMIVDSSNGSLTQLKANWYLAQERGATELEVLMLTHYHRKEISSLANFLESVQLRNLWLPTPYSEAERIIYDALCESARTNGVAVSTYDFGESLTVFGTGEITQSAPVYIPRSAQAAFSLSIRYGGTCICYHTAALSECLREQGGTHVCEGDILILGAHGPVPHEPIELPEHTGLHTVLLASQEIAELLARREGVTWILFPEEEVFCLE